MPTNVERFTADIGKMQKQVPVMATHVYQRLALKICNAVIVGDSKYSCPGTPVDKGIARGSWVPSIGKPAKSGPKLAKKRKNQKPGHPDTSVIFKATLNDPIYMTSYIPYMKRLEYEGWSNQAPRGFVRLAIKAGKHMLKDILKKGGLSGRSR